MTDRSDEARRDLATSIKALDRLVITVPPLQALADFALDGLMARPGYDRETDSADPILQFQVELLQAFVLRHDVQEFATTPMRPHQFEEIHRVIRHAADSFVLRSFADSVGARDDPKKGVAADSAGPNAYQVAFARLPSGSCEFVDPGS